MLTKVATTVCSAALLCLLTACSGGNTDQPNEDSRDDDFLAAVHEHFALAETVVADFPTDDELLRVGQLFCNRWRAAIDDPVRMDGPFFVVQEMRRQLEPSDADTLGLVWLHAEDHLCPELLEN